jgi:hypothetical protein
MWLLKLPLAMSLLHTGQCLVRGGVNSARADELVVGGDDVGGAAGIDGDTVAGDGSDERDETGAVAAVGVDVTGMNVRLNVRRTEGETLDELPPTAERVRGRDI